MKYKVCFFHENEVFLWVIKQKYIMLRTHENIANEVVSYLNQKGYNAYSVNSMAEAKDIVKCRMPGAYAYRLEFA